MNENVSENAPKKLKINAKVWKPIYFLSSYSENRHSVLMVGGEDG